MDIDTPTGTRAIVRDVAASFDHAIRPHGSGAEIDVGLAREQHRRYCAALETLGLSLIEIEADDRFPDCCYVEDTALVFEQLAIVTIPGAESRRGETVAVEAVLGDYRPIHRLKAPATLDGGDVLRIGDRIFVGLSERTMGTAVGQLARVLTDYGFDITPVEVRDVLHLKTACTYLGNDTITVLAGHLDSRAFGPYRQIPIPADEAHAANCLSLNGAVLVPAGAPATRKMIEAAGFETVELDISESRKAGGGLTCSSLIF